MTVPEINIWAVVLATLSTMVVGSLWYSPKVFGEYWMAKAAVNRDTTTSRGAWPIVVTVVVSFVTAWVLAGATAIAHDFYQGSFLGDAMITALLLWAGFTAARMITHDAFEARPAGLTAVNLAHELLTVLVMGLVIGLMGV
ncbi:DUF1761 domain-containing protein [Actinotalea sp. M2MS4P-6]|uniref:DUF1761 domain-containing protein n=1 Tax=Actinotalea sp. M2MS4P-6 TaxID=2983762 RepID=UPI0021E42D6B|nr:DUF1761 domain-containing protein [Actinotalea sp. M2MS4P-6]MCV2396397.1 DUF1761 domain-containing protein [Actinotalea sp. M2MS4P-6]